MKPWQSTYPAQIVQVVTPTEIVFNIHLGFDIYIMRAIGLEYSKEYDANQKLFIKRRLENLLSNAKNIVIEMYWENASQPFCEVLVDGNDLIDMIEEHGVLPRD